MCLYLSLNERAVHKRICYRCVREFGISHSGGIVVAGFFQCKRIILPACWREVICGVRRTNVYCKTVCRPGLECFGRFVDCFGREGRCSGQNRLLSWSEQAVVSVGVTWYEKMPVCLSFFKYIWQLVRI